LTNDAKDAVIVLSVTDFVDREIGHLKDKVDIRFQAQQEALALAMVRLNERLGEMNELRAQITMERGSYLLRERFDTEHQTLINRVSAIELLSSKVSGSIWMLGAAISAIVVGINLLMRFWPAAK
jgi:hypothetical protein